jgi:hypothetical protein
VYRRVRLNTPVVILDGPHASIWPAAYSACWSWGHRCHPLLKSSPIKGEEEEASRGPVFPLPRWEGIKGRVGSLLPKHLLVEPARFDMTCGLLSTLVVELPVSPASQIFPLEGEREEASLGRESPLSWGGGVEGEGS